MGRLGQLLGGMMDIQAQLQTISQSYCSDEQQAVDRLRQSLQADETVLAAVTTAASQLINQVRAQSQTSLMQQVLQEFSLDSEEGKALMALAESLLRVPDRAVAQSLISDKLQRGDWQQAQHGDHPLFIQVSALLLGFGGNLLAGHRGDPQQSSLRDLVRRFSGPVVQRALMQMIRVLAGQFVFADNIDAALKRAARQSHPQQRFSFDMLGEAAICQQQASRFFDSYRQAIAAAGRSGGEDGNISIKLSALSPRFAALKFERVVPELSDVLNPLLALAAEHGVGITIDAEEADKLDITLAVFCALFRRWGKALAGRLGLAVQAYSLRAMPVLQCLRELADTEGVPVAVRLVKGAYWDSEIKLAQVAGLDGYPVFTEKLHTDLSYLACAEFLLRHPRQFYPQFATHNPVTLSHILCIAQDHAAFECQRLYGMGGALYDALLAQHPTLRCRAYCPVGEYRQLLPYLVRRILENGANNSMVRQLVGSDVDVAVLSTHPLTLLRQGDYQQFRLPRPGDLFAPGRANSATVNLASIHERHQLLASLAGYADTLWSQQPLTASAGESGEAVAVSDPASGRVIGQCLFADTDTAERALDSADKAARDWRARDAEHRAQLLERFADELEANREELIAMLVYEAGKSLGDSIDELREAVDFCRYYAQQARGLFSEPRQLHGPVGERNTLGWQGRGVFLCISPWNFPLAIFVGQVAAALAAGNTVLAKPAEQTPLIACRAVELMYRAGFARDVVQCLPGPGASLAAALLPDSRLAGVAFTGSTATARQIHRQLAGRSGAMVPLIAETGGQNAMIVDSSALPEQVVKDVIHSAFLSAGQRCSALRVLFVQEEVSATLIDLLSGAMDVLQMGNPADPTTDIGPVIDAEAAQSLRRHIDDMRSGGNLIHSVALPAALAPERFVPPTLLRIESMDALTQEHFGPVLHVITYDYRDIDAVIEQIHRSEYGLTVGIASRNEAFCDSLADKLMVGNVYINRGMTGAVVGVQPFGGMGLSGTGPKAGGPNYLQRFAVEKTISNNIAAIGGNVSLLVQ